MNSIKKRIMKCNAFVSNLNIMMIGSVNLLCMSLGRSDALKF